MTGEIGGFLNRFFETTADNHLTSHSLKETTLSWCAKFGVDEDCRTLLGHHGLSSQGKGTLLATCLKKYVRLPMEYV